MAWVSTTGSQEGIGDETDHVMVYPATVNANERLTAIIALQAATTGTWPVGWTKILDFDVTAGTAEVGWRIADGTEGGGSFIITTPSGLRSAHLVIVHSGRHLTTASEVSTGVDHGTTTAPDSDSLNPSGWDNEETDWITITQSTVGSDSNVTTYPTNYLNGQEQNAAGGGGGASVAAATRLLTAASEDPGVFAADSAVWYSETVALRPAGAAAVSQLPEMDRMARSFLYSPLLRM